MYFHNSAYSFSSYSPVISGVWEQCWKASINIWRSGNYHRPRSIETSSYSECMTTIQSVAWHERMSWLVPVTINTLSKPLFRCFLVTIPTTKIFSWPWSFFLLACVTAQWFNVMWLDKDNLSGLFQQQGGNSIHREGGREGQWHVRAKNIALQAWRNVAARGMRA